MSFQILSYQYVIKNDVIYYQKFSTEKCKKYDETKSESLEEMGVGVGYNKSKQVNIPNMTERFILMDDFREKMSWKLSFVNQVNL